uniref:Uncharacterized protein n=1 Tax=Ananas comosus var. bracteatus TaxID=296719 RepID=A0A6V7PKI3_ANACO|nr:unnamed protein product [Ananas comosus var. bracteatus]
MGGARNVFDEIPKRSIMVWTAVISGYSQMGSDSEALELFVRMLATGCSHGGLVDEGLSIFDYMIKEKGLKPEIGHYGCIVDLLGRAGRIEKALDFIKICRLNRPQLCGVRYWAHVEFTWQDVVDVRKLMMEKAVIKEPGRSWIILDKVIHTFYSSDQFHPKKGEIEAKIKEIYAKIKEAGFVPDLSCVLHDVDDEQNNFFNE